VDLGTLNPEFQVNPNPYPGVLRPKIKEKKYLFPFWIKNCNLIIPRPPRTSMLQKKRSDLKRELTAL
jgi:hypothetical protein